jgi:hypothetical protein
MAAGCVRAAMTFICPAQLGQTLMSLSKGLPICFSSSTGWYDPASPEERATFWYARDQEDLNLMSKVIRLEVEDRQQMLRGLEVASAGS